MEKYEVGREYDIEGRLRVGIGVMVDGREWDVSAEVLEEWSE